jgi:hypothetical protein
LVEAEAGRRGFSKEAGLVGGAERNRLIKHAAADFGDVPVF